MTVGHLEPAPVCRRPRDGFAIDTYLFSPPRGPRRTQEPARPRPPRPLGFGLRPPAVARPSTSYNWLYYTGEWNEGWYPGYSDAWAEYRGAIGILYEQAGFAEDGVRMPSGSHHHLSRAVHHQAVSSLANLRHLQANAARLLRRSLSRERLALGEPPTAPMPSRTFAILPTENNSRRERLSRPDAVAWHRVYTWHESIDLAALRRSTRLGRTVQRRTSVRAAGTLLIPNRQPKRPAGGDDSSSSTTRMTEDYLRRERKSDPARTAVLFDLRHHRLER